jgi:hypothetical protein
MPVPFVDDGSVVVTSVCRDALLASLEIYSVITLGE